ncbi:MAG: hypothetical protein KatS3mg102_2050 [Planctomycetota bacterium]|nr:MAG: hypothetical protein KatS3mg102_2050 [Planctomycetota bacterium]
MLDIMYELPSREEIRHYVITPEVVAGAPFEAAAAGALAGADSAGSAAAGERAERRRKQKRA